MPKGAYTAKQERKADHIAEGYRQEGVSKKEAEERAWRTVNKQDKGGKNDGSGRSRSRSFHRGGHESRQRGRGMRKAQGAGLVGGHAAVKRSRAGRGRGRTSLPACGGGSRRWLPAGAPPAAGGWPRRRDAGRSE